ncbi:uncharacterized protein FFB20_01611 [Fusarium fujikuroi]|uniref:Uncharacterized protein n=4 Tax=Fusarium fujikuroi species complex TaxID=171627 RepID=S0EKX8_GIBF5|nr:uncharacterized protein FFUJ_10597 [Fusarium fujikuroi IMI 58289]XP_031084901.1 uncharacterized protein FPRO_14120 [Fusarium proliferatum ET1]KAG4257264.1 hypothetical protein FPRO03_04274 [Fusarium proliferatum]KAI1064361.1 hypothetical protein LB506_007545 [Fusarium annulatum]KLO83064.1 uncharacterized protein Y057_6186 [Fusarium fujikuroi]KAG4275491.1 hypothetical protein FPRO04_08404 [Fusarium proliferatum]KAG4293063.1 hypothetical protein FPRO06_12551 [Fusarium proliferatum]
MKDRTSDHIHFPQHAHRIPRRSDGVSGYSDLLGRAVLISIINYLADVVDAIEDIKLPKQHKDRTKLKNDKKRMCDTAVRGANTLTALFNSAKGQTKYTDPAPKNLPLYRDEIRGQLLYPLSKAKTSKPSLGKSFTFAPWQQRLTAILSGIEEEVCWWLRLQRPTKTYDKRSTTHSHTSKAYGQRSTASKPYDQYSTRTGKTDQRSSRPKQTKSHSQRGKRSRSPSPSGGCAVM